MGKTADMGHIGQISGGHVGRRKGGLIREAECKDLVEKLYKDVRQVLVVKVTDGFGECPVGRMF